MTRETQTRVGCQRGPRRRPGCKSVGGRRAREDFRSQCGPSPLPGVGEDPAAREGEVGLAAPTGSLSAGFSSQEGKPLSRT